MSSKDKKLFMSLYRFFYDILTLSSPNKEDRYNRHLLYKEHYQKGYFFHDGKIINNDLTVLVQLAIRNNDHSWAQTLLNTHTPALILGTKYPQETYNLLWADYYYYAEDYDKVLERVEIRLFENPSYSILADILLVKIYFDQRNELLEYRMKSLYQKVRRTKMSDYLKGRYFNFLRHLEKIYKYRHKNSDNKKQQILEGIKAEKNIYERDWLIEKINECK